jgi:hypothetical protein
MFQRDYLTRMIEQITTAIGQVAGLRERKEHLEAMKVIDELFNRQFRLNSRLIRSLHGKDLMDMMTVNGAVDTISLQAVALLLKEQGELEAELDHENESYVRSLKALDLFLRLALIEAEPTVADPRKEAGELLAALREFELPADTKTLAYRWKELEGSYDEAENWLHELLEDEVLDAGTAAAFYHRLLLLPEDRLQAGGLSREEAELGLAALK